MTTTQTAEAQARRTATTLGLKVAKRTHGGVALYTVLSADKRTAYTAPLTLAALTDWLKVRTDWLEAATRTTT